MNKLDLEEANERNNELIKKLIAKLQANDDSYQTHDGMQKAIELLEEELT
jgi:hypothetical protein